MHSCSQNDCQEGARLFFSDAVMDLFECVDSEKGFLLACLLEISSTPHATKLHVRLEAGNDNKLTLFVLNG